MADQRVRQQCRAHAAVREWAIGRHAADYREKASAQLGKAHLDQPNCRLEARVASLLTLAVNAEDSEERLQARVASVGD